MPTFIIERELPGASTLTHQELADITAKSNDVVARSNTNNLSGHIEQGAFR